MATIQVFAQPNTLYRYRSLEKLDQEIDALEKKYVFCADFSSMNDPMEGFFDLSSRLATSPTSRVIKRAITIETTNVGISSFCEAHDNELMWAHYANQFKGICIAYHFRRLVGEIPDDVYFTRMHYTEKIPTVGISTKEPDYLAKRVLSYKHYRWLYEREWRMFAPKGRIHYRTHSSVRRVYLGHRVEAPKRAELKSRLKKIDIVVKAMSLNGYSIEF